MIKPLAKFNLNKTSDKHFATLLKMILNASIFQEHFSQNSEGYVH